MEKENPFGRIIVTRQDVICILQERERETEILFILFFLL